MEPPRPPRRSRAGLFVAGALALLVAVLRMVVSAESADGFVFVAVSPALVFLLAAFAPAGAVDDAADLADVMRGKKAFPPGEEGSRRQMTPEELREEVKSAVRRWLAVFCAGLAVISILFASFAPFAIYALVAGKSDHWAVYGSLLGAVSAWPFLELGKMLQRKI